MDDREIESSQSLNDWENHLDTGRMIRDASRRSAPRRDAHRGWGRIRTIPRRGVLTVKILGQLLLRDSDIDDVSEEILDLVAAGYNRMVIDFEDVERLTSRIVGVVVAVQRRCLAGEGGMLRLCGLRSEVAELFALAGLVGTIPIDRSENEALNASWPELPQLRPLPVSILRSLVAGRSSLSGRAMTTRTQVDPSNSRCKISPRPRIRLILLEGRAKSRAKRVLGLSILIGRDPDADIRIEDEMVSRRHARIEVQGDRMVLRDLGSRNGTRRNGQFVQGEAIELVQGDRVHIGPVSLLVELETSRTNNTHVEERVADWLEVDPTAGSPAGAELFPTLSRSNGVAPQGTEPIEIESASAGLIKAVMLDDVLVMTPTQSRLDEERTVDALREALEASLRTDATRVVIDLSCVTHVSSRAIGLLLAHHLRLERSGSALRLCHVPARVFACLDRVRLPMLMNTFPQVDDAVVTAWS